MHSGDTMTQDKRQDNEFSSEGVAVTSRKDKDGYHIRIPAYFHIVDGSVVKARLERAGSYSGNLMEWTEYDLTNKRDVANLKRRGIFQFVYKTPTKSVLWY